MNSNEGPHKSLDEIKEQMDQAEAAFHQAASQESFVDACQRLRQAFDSLGQASAATRDAEAKLLQAQNLPADSARRISQGIPSLGDLRQALFPKEKSNKPADPRLEPLHQAWEQATAREHKAQAELAAAVQHFLCEKEIVLKAAIELVTARQAYEQAAGSLKQDELAGLAQFAWQELVQLPAVEGLEMLIIPD